MLQWIIIELNLPVPAIGIDGKRSTNRSLYHDSAWQQFWPAQAVPIGANSSAELVLLSLYSALFHHMCSDLPWSSIVSLKSLHLLRVSNREGENWVWTVLLICFMEPTPFLLFFSITSGQVVQETDSYCWGPRSLKRNTGSRKTLCSFSFLFSNQCCSGENARIDTLQSCSIGSPWVSAVLDCHTGSLYNVSISDRALLQFLQRSKRDWERLAALHCALLYFQHTEDLEMQVGNEPPVNFFPVTDTLYKAGAGHEWCQPEKSWFTWQCQEAQQLGCPKPLHQSRLSWKHLCLYHYSMQSVATKTKFSILTYDTCLNRELWQAPCSHSDRLFAGFLRTCQHVILLTPFKNLSLVGIIFPA